MEQKRTILLVGALVLLSCVAYLTGVFDSAPSTIQVPEVDVPTEEVTTIEISSPNLNTLLVKDGGIWRVTAPVSGLADSLAVGRLLDSIEDLELLTIVSTNQERHSRYGVDAAQAISLRLAWGGQEINLKVAAEGPDFSSSYLRLEEGAEVFSSTPRVSMPTTLDQLRDKTLANVLAASVVEADVTSPEHAYLLRYGVSGWSIATDGGSPVPADSTKIAAWLRRFAPLKLDGFLDDWSKESVSVSHTVRLTEATGATHRLFLGATGDTLAAYTDGSNGVYRTFATRLQSLIETPEALTLTQ